MLNLCTILTIVMLMKIDIFFNCMCTFLEKKNNALCSKSISHRMAELSKQNVTGRTIV